jgi:transcription antitermination factor NusG
MEINEEKGLVKVEINILGRDTPVEIDFMNVKLKK